MHDPANRAARCCTKYSPARLPTCSTRHQRSNDKIQFLPWTPMMVKPAAGPADAGRPSHLGGLCLCLPASSSLAPQHEVLIVIIINDSYILTRR